MIKIKAYVFVFLVGLFSSCGVPQTQEMQKVRYHRVDMEKLNDSTIEYTNWVDTNHADIFLISKLDTIDRYTLSKDKGYFSYKYFNERAEVVKLKLYVKVAGRFKLNEIIFIDSQGQVIKDRSLYIQTEEKKDSLKLTVSNEFNRTFIIAGDTTAADFDTDKWIKADTVKSPRNFVVVPKELGNRKCMLRAIILDKKGNVEGGMDFYFDVNNLLCRDVRKALICDEALK